MGNLVFGSAERPGNSADAAEIPVVRDNGVAIGQGARPTERPEKASAAERYRSTSVGNFIGTRQMAPQTTLRGWSRLRLEGNLVHHRHLTDTKYHVSYDK